MNELRPEHYKEGEDTFDWAERKYGLETCLAICEFNIHKYNDRSKDDDYKDFGKIADYAMWARDMMERNEAGEKGFEQTDVENRVTTYDARFVFSEEHRAVEIDIATKLREGNYRDWMLHGFDGQGFAAIINSKTTRTILVKDFEGFVKHLNAFPNLSGHQDGEK